MALVLEELPIHEVEGTSKELSLEGDSKENRKPLPQENTSTATATASMTKQLKRLKLIQKLALPPNVTEISFEVRGGSHYLESLAKAETKGSVIEGWLTDVAVSKIPKSKSFASISPSTIKVVVCPELNKIIRKKRKDLKRLRVGTATTTTVDI